MLKRYCTHSMKLSFAVEVNGKLINVRFNGRDAERKLSTYQTEDKSIQDAIENTHHFGQYYWSDPKIIIQDEDNAAELEVKEFATINEAKDFLIALNVAKNKLPNPAAIINKGKELGFDIKFEIINK